MKMLTRVRRVDSWDIKNNPIGCIRTLHGGRMEKIQKNENINQITHTKYGMNGYSYPVGGRIRIIKHFTTKNGERFMEFTDLAVSIRS